mgnify:FL=1
MKLIITQQSQKHINYLLGRYKDTEWSGPAFYSVKYDDNGFPATWTLKGFITLDLGDTTSTEWDGEDWVKVSKEIYKAHPEYQKCFMGLIHSHHNMGAYFSGTDKTQLKEASNKVGYPSLVVAHSKDRFAFAISYLDNFGKAHMYEAKDISVQEPKVKPLDEWIKYADRMDKNKKKAPTLYYSHFRNKPGVGQVALWGGFQEEEAKMQKEEAIEEAFEEAEENMTKAEKHLEEHRISKKKYNKIKKQFDKVSKAYIETIGDDNDDIQSWNDSFGVI